MQLGLVIMFEYKQITNSYNRICRKSVFRLMCLFCFVIYLNLNCFFKNKKYFYFN